jgi:protein TonB
MVRTLPAHTPARLDASRILATSFALAVHAIALLVLLLPLGQAPLPQARAPAAPERWKVSEPAPLPPLPPQPVATSTPQPPRPVSRPLQAPPRPSQAPVVVENAAVALPDPGVETALADPGPVAISGPLPGAQLRYASAPPPPYPSDALRAGEQGTVTLKVLVDTDGRPLQVQVHGSSGSRSLDRQAVRHVQQRWRFEPALHQGQAVQAWGLVPIVFALQ